MIAAAVLDVDDLDVRILFLDPVHEAVAATDSGAAGLVVHDDRNLACAADELGHLVRSVTGRGNVVGGCRRNGNVAVHARVKADDRDVRGLRLLQLRDQRLAVQCGQGQALRVLSQRRFHHLQLLVNLGFRLGALERDLNVQILGRGLGALLDSLPELVLEALRDHRDVDPLCCGGLGRRGSSGGLRRGRARAQQHRNHHQRRHDDKRPLHVASPSLGTTIVSPGWGKQPPS